MSEIDTDDRQQLAGELADTHRGCECRTCMGEAERFIVAHIDPMTAKGLAEAWEEGWQAGAFGHSPDLGGEEAHAASPNPHRATSAPAKPA